jgi:hypothetical protein
MLLNSILSSIISSNEVSSSAISPSAITTPSLPQYGIAMVCTLILIVAIKEILSSSQRWSKYLDNSFNLAIIPFTITFLMIIFFKLRYLGVV